MQEAGYPTFDFDGWFGVMAPAGTPKPIIAKLNKDFGTVLADAAQKKRFAVLGVELVGSTPEAFDKLIARDAERFGKIFKPEAK
jgi:tripartite-type tricarboxylate transporter receptor subunit TctC